MSVRQDTPRHDGWRALGAALRLVLRAPAFLWREIVSATEWMSHGGRIRPHTREGSSWDDFTWGMGPPDPVDDEDRAEHGQLPPG